MGKITPIGRIGNFAGGLFYLVVGISGGLILPTEPFSKLKTTSVKIEHWLKSKLAWYVCTKGMNLKEKWYRRWYTIAAKNEVFIGL